MRMEKTICCPQCGSTEVFVKGSMCICGECMHRFEAPEEPVSGQAAEPMRLFLSYGHPESEICQRICAALKEHGYDPWFDQSDIRTGDNWRVSIQEGVRSSNAVVACLSPHSTRERGVCLDELAIAVGVKGGNVHSILLAPEQEVKPPATIEHEQWLDMSDWKEQKAAGPDVFAEWFRGKMQELFRVLDSKETREFNGQIQYIHDHLNVCYDTSRQNALLQKRFVGRAWLEENLEHWMDDPAGKRMCLLYGGPGVGKSAFAVHYTHYNSRVAACLFCRSDMEVYNAPRTVIQTLAYLLACRLPEYRQSLLMHLPENKAELERLSEKELFARLLEEPLRLSVDGGHQTMVLVVDGLDECGSPEENALARTLAAYADSLPAWLRILIVARATPAVTAYAAGAWKLEIAADAAANRADIRAYYEACLQAQFAEDPQWNASLEALTARSQGTFLYAEMMCSLLQERGTLSAAEEYPDGLDAMFAAWFQYFFPDRNDYCRNWRLPLSCLLGAKAPLPEAALRRVMGWSAGQLRDFCQRINVLLRRGTNTFGDNTLSIDHAYIRQWLQRDQPYAAPAEDGIEAQARAFYAHLEEDADSLSFYEAVQLPVLLQQAGMKKQCTALVQNQAWRDTVMEAGDLCRDWGKLEEAEKIFTDALELVQQVGREANLDAESFRGECQERLGRIRRLCGDLKGAMELFQSNFKTREKLRRIRGTWDDWEKWSIGCDKIANLYCMQGRLDKAAEMFQQMLENDEELVRKRGLPKDRSGLAYTCDRVANLYEAKGDWQKAEEMYEKACLLAEHEVQQHRTLKDKKRLATIYMDLADIHKVQGRLDEAMNWYQKSLVLREQVVQERGTPGDKSSLAASYNCIADICQSQGRLDEALSMYQKDCALSEQVVQERGTPGDKSSLAASYNCIAGIYQSQGRLDEALSMYQKDCALSEQVVQERGTPGDKSSLAISYGCIAGIYQSQGRLDEALSMYQKDCALSEQVVQERGTPGDKSSLAISYGCIAGIYKSQGRLDEALNWYQKSLVLREQVVQERGTPGDKSSLADSNYEIAYVYEKQGRYDKALNLYRKVYEQAQQLSEWRTTLCCCVAAADILRKEERKAPQPKKTFLGIFKRKREAPKESLQWIEQGRALLRRLMAEAETEQQRKEYAQTMVEFNKLW